MNLQDFANNRGKIVVPVEENTEFFPKGILSSDKKTKLRYKIGAVKTWKRDATRFEISLQRGLYEHYKVTTVKEMSLFELYK